MDVNTELRKLPAGHLFRLAQILESGEAWKRLMSIIPKSDDEGTTALKYNMEHIELIERASATQRRRSSEILLEEWSTSGRRRPDLATLLQLLVQADLFRAAEFVAFDLLKGAAPVRPNAGPSAVVDLSDETIEELSRLQLRHLEQARQLDETPAEPYGGLPPPPGASGGGGSPSRREADADERLTQIQETIEIDSLHLDPMRPDCEVARVPAPEFETRLPRFPYADLRAMTDDFCDVALADRGRRLGSGAFGSVYLARLPASSEVAVKRLNRDAVNLERQFRNEVEALSKFCHPNLLPLLGYSCDGPHYCLVYEYMCNGSLQERLAQKAPLAVLPWRLRVNVGLGTSRGIHHLHSAFEKPLIHRDVKTANILLDRNLEPKLGDFGLVRLGSNGQRSQSVALTTTVFGTSAYMAREAFRGDISVKIDTYSFGVVILELLTGLAPFDDQREEGHDLVTYVENVCEESIISLLDMSAGDWGNSDIVRQLFALSLDCLEDKRRRPDMGDVVGRLQAIANTAGGHASELSFAKSERSTERAPAP